MNKDYIFNNNLNFIFPIIPFPNISFPNMDILNNNLSKNITNKNTNAFKGFEFEDYIHNNISQCKYPVLREKDVVNEYGKISYGVDHLIKGPNYNISIQDKWKNSKPTLADINHFIKATERISEIDNKYCIGIYLTKLPLTSYARNAFDHENSFSRNKFIEICFDSQHDIMNNLSKLLYSLEIYFYEPDGSAIMLE